MEFSRVERAAIEAILSKPVEGMEAVRTQFAAASVIERDYTGVGFFTKISVPPSMPPLADSRQLHDALFDGAAGTPGVFFMLWTDTGYIACLEGFTVLDSWPNEDDIAEIEPCRTMRGAKRTRFAENDLVPGSDSMFETRWQDTTVGVLLRIAFLALIIVLAVMAVATFIGVL